MSIHPISSTLSLQPSLIPVTSTSGSIETAKRLKEELHLLLENPLPYCTAGPRGDNLLEWAAVLEGPKGTPYEGGLFFVDLSFPQQYPFKAPKITFRTRIFHCNITPSGCVVIELIKGGWKAELGVQDILRSLHHLLQQCHPEEALVEEIGLLYENNRHRYEKVAKSWTARYAT